MTSLGPVPAEERSRPEANAHLPVHLLYPTQSHFTHHGVGAEYEED